MQCEEHLNVLQFTGPSTHEPAGAMESHLSATAYLVLALVSTTSGFFWTPRGPQMYPCLTYMERNLRVDCEFPVEDNPAHLGPYCEYKQDSRLVGSTYPNAVSLVSTDNRRRANVSLVNPTVCRLTWAPMADDKPYTYTCRVYQGSTWKENSMAVHQRILPICSALSVMFHTGLFLLSLVMTLPVTTGLLSP
ncbi:uncharacterized protein si:ch211-215c18.3 isoform X2 [Oncorhynchus nerka]|uniref:uncharacterized protein si:ch211-215c18.3 isoform X2 n=1 Tax=Oncorhynchus nerka TaxID=8023 RepID=UPI0011318CC1|nr:uncharacterized protein LOC115136386 isoform X2 [Oncorhynchus nerka]